MLKKLECDSWVGCFMKKSAIVAVVFRSLPFF